MTLLTGLEPCDRKGCDKPPVVQVAQVGPTMPMSRMTGTWTRLLEAKLCADDYERSKRGEIRPFRWKHIGERAGR